MYCHDSEGVKHQLLSIVDFSSSYHVVVAVSRKDTYHLERAFCEHGLNVFGAPKVLAIDMETGLEKSLSRIGDYTGTKIRHAAGQAHWQAGCTERQGALWKTIFAKINDEMAITKSDLHLAIGAVSSAKNNLIKTSGYSPVQHVFGSTANIPEDLLNGRRAFDLGDEPVIDDSHAREVAIRTSARIAFHQVQTDERVRRALLGRARVSQRRPEIGEQVFYWRKPATSKNGRWLGPATVIGHEDNNVWVTKSGRCVLCAPEHLRLATGEELGEAFSLRAAREDLERLLQADDEPDEAFIKDDPDIEDYEEADDEEMAELDGEDDERPPRGGQRRSQEAAPPQVLKRHRTKGPDGQGGGHPHANSVCMLKTAKTARSREKQVQKEIPWSQIPPEVRPLFREAESKQWGEHIATGALELLDVKASEEIRRTVPAERILGSRFAYRDKNLGKRRAVPTTPWRAKSRLVAAGHKDPDLGSSGSIEVDAPTVARSTLIALLQLCASKQWTAAAGDAQAAFLQGLELRRDLWLSLPRDGIEGVDPRQLAKIKKGIFGLSESPRMWFDRVCQVLLSETFVLADGEYKFRPCPLDPCVFILTKEGDDGEPAGYLALHVDDILLVAPSETNKTLQRKISSLFPVEDWEEDEFEYTGSHIKVTVDGIYVNQASFCEGRLFQVDVDKGQNGDDPATEEQAIDNRSLLGALSWLATQSRPDLQCGDALGQQLQRAPLVRDVRFSNSLTAKALRHKEKGIVLRPIPLEEIVFVTFHDAGWANAEHEEAEDGFRLTPQEIEQGTIHDLYTSDRPRVAKRTRSRIASQLGHLIMVFPKKFLYGEKAAGSLMEWRSQSCKRVCRSTFGAETMSAVEALEGCQYMRSLFATLLKGSLVKVETARDRWPLLCITDCKSVFDHLHRAGVPRIPSDRRLAIDLAALRQELQLERWAAKLPLQWVPTECQLADPLTKPMKVDDFWTSLWEGIKLPFRKDLFHRGKGF